jgi:mono/diheme cytochrome c family protein
VREKTARALALGTGLLVIVAVFAFGILRQPDALDSAPDRAAVPPAAELPRPADRPHAEPLPANDTVTVPDTLIAVGQRVYREQRCARCHSIAGEGSPRSPLDGVGSYLTEEEIRLWIVAPQEMAPRVRKPAYDHLPEHEVDALVAYMQSLKEPEA